MSRYFPPALLIVALSLNGAPAGDDPVRRTVDHPVVCLAVSPDGKTLAVGGAVKKGNPRDIHQPGKCTLLDVSTGKVVRSIATERAVLAIAFSPDSKRLLLGERDRHKLVPADKKGSVFPRVWDVTTGKSVLELDGHTDLISGAAFFPDGKRMITASGDGTARVWGSATGKELLLIKTGSFNYGLALSPNGKHVAVGSGHTRLTIWDTESGKAVFTAKVGYSTTNVAFAPDGSLVAVCSHGANDITLWDGKRGLRKGSILVGYDRDRKTAVAGNVTSNLIFAPDGKWLVTGNGALTDDDRAGEVTVWHVAGRKKYAGYKGHPGRVRALAFTPDGKALVSASADGTVLLWDFAKAVKGKSE
jgi:WD40 repeat protein